MATHLVGSAAASCVSFARGIVVLSGGDVQSAAKGFMESNASVPATWQAKQRSRDGDSGHHVTLLTKADVQTAVEKLKASPDGSPSLWPADLERPSANEAGVVAAVGAFLQAYPRGLAWFSCGEGRARDGSNEASFLVVLWPAGAAIRRALSLPPRDFHITLGFSNADIHDKAKGLAALCSGVPSFSDIQGVLSVSESLLTAGDTAWSGVQGSYDLASAVLQEAAASATSSAECSARRLLCQACGKLARHDEVLLHSAQLLDVSPDDELARRCRAFALVMTGDYEQGLEELQATLALLHKVPEAERKAVKDRVSQAQSLCKRKLGASSSSGGYLAAQASCNDHSDAGASQAKDNYPSTPHLPFSPGIHSDDTKMADCADLLKEEVVITEKLDGGNCCIKDGVVYARTHSQPATHESFSAVKELVYGFAEDLEGLELYGENMAAIHSVEYANLTSYFYLFGIRQGGRWLAWEEVVDMASRLDIPTVPERFRGNIRDQKHLQSLIEGFAGEPSAVGAGTKPEGFVVRRSAAFGHGQFSASIAKFVRANFNQLDGTSKRNWRKAKLGASLPAPQVAGDHSSLSRSPPSASAAAAAAATADKATPTGVAASVAEASRRTDPTTTIPAKSSEEGSSMLPAAFLEWLQASLLSEVSAADADSLIPSIEVILGGALVDDSQTHREALEAAEEVLREEGAAATADNLAPRWSELL
eukprot:TRINITY_DN19905_c0_g2_i1.p1 TRINITY_DN19905_c0_g2~~TRINITY_DN19905_c0_g2_i1.p1  ORF type:complete len:740 (+),score=121.88 TRINITY_DN19905_c0_g2_i1:100-2220(+)